MHENYEISEIIFTDEHQLCTEYISSLKTKVTNSLSEILLLYKQVLNKVR